MENVQDGQDQYQLQPEIGVYSHADCPVCNGDEKAVARQARLEASAEKLFEPLDRMGDHLENAYLNVKGIIKPNGAHVGQGTSLSLRRGGRHQLPAKPNALSQLAGKQVAAGALAFLSAASPAAADVLDATQTLPPAVAEAPPELNIKPSAFSPEIMIERYRNNTRETIAAPLAGYEPEMLPASAPAPEPETEKIAAGVEQPLIRTLFPGQTIRDFVNTVAGDLPREQRVSLIEQIAQDSGVDLAAGEDRNLKVGFELKIPIETAGLELYTVKKGDTAAQLYDKLGFKDAGYSFDQFLQAQAIVDKDSIRTGWAMFKPADADHLTVALADKPNPPTPPSAPTAPGNEPVPVPPRKPETVLSEPVPKQPQTIDGPPDNGQLAAITRHLQTELPEIGLVVVDEDQISLENGRYMNRQEAGSALDLLIETISDYENPLHDMPVSPMEQEPTPEADRLRANRSDLIDDLTDGNTNLAFVQSEVLQRLSAQSNGRVDAEQMQDIASHFVRFIAERNDWVLSDEEAGNLAGLMIRGAMPIDLSGASHARLEAASLSERFNHSALTVDLYDASLREHLDEQVELVRLAEQQLELLRSNMRDLSEDELRAIAQTTIAATLSGQPTNDYSYEVFRAKIGEQVNEATVLKLLGRQFYASRDSDDLLELLPSVEAKLAETVDGWLAAEGPKSLSGLLETIDSQLDGQIAAITERGEQLQELELDLEELDPALTDLSGEQIYELAKTILSAEEKQQRVGDDWLYLIELKAPAGESLDQTLLNLEEGIYRVQGADLLLSGSEQEQAAVAEAIEQFLAGSERNVKAFLDTQFGSLEQRLATAESEVMAIVELAAGVLPEWSMSEDKLSALPVRRLVGLTNQGLINELKKAYTNETGRQLTSEQGALIDIGLIRLETPDQADRLDQFSLGLLEYFNQQNASFYLTGADDPAVRTLAQMLEEGRHTVDYSDGEMSIFSDEFMDKLRAYNTIPSSLFPGNQWLIKGYAGQDLRPFFERLGLDADAILASPYNDRLKLADGQITADANGAIWFSAELWGGGKSPDFEEATEWTYGEIPGLSYTVKKGQTYGEIANMFRVDGKVPDWHEIIEWNRGRIPSDPTKLRVGTEVVIPQGWAVHIDLDYGTGIEVEAGGQVTNDGPSPQESLPQDAKITRTDLGTLGTIEIVQLDDTFSTNRTMTPTAVVNHWTGGDYDDAKPLENFLRGIKGNKACKGGCSVHFFISEQGTIYQLSNLNSHLAHAKGANDFGVGIEIEGSWGSDGMPNSAQYEAAKQLNAYLVQELNLKLDNDINTKKGILGHYEVDGSYLDPDDSGKTDPGKKFLNQLRSDIGEWVNPPSATDQTPDTASLSLASEHDRIEGKVAKELASLPVYDNPYGLTASDINSPELVLTVDEMAQNRLDRNASGNSWDSYIGPSEGAQEIMEALIVYGGLHEIDAPGWTTDELLIAATATFLGEGSGYTHIVGDLKLQDGARLNPTDNVKWQDEIASISTSSGQFYWTNKLDGSFRDPELVGNDHRIAANRAGRMIREELAAGRPILDKWHYYRDWEEEHSDGYLAHVETAKKALENIKAGQ